MLLFCIPLLNSCEDDQLEVVQPPAYDFTWVDDAQLIFTPQDESSFVYNINKGTGDEFWSTTEVSFDISFQSEEATVSEIDKIDLYIFAEERNGDDYNYIGSDEGKLLTTIENPSQSMQIEVTKDDLYELFENDFTTSRSDLIPGDLFEIRWVITGKEGEVYDSRSDCSGFNCSFGFIVEQKIVDTWVGEFEYTWTEVGPGTVSYSYKKVNVGSKGTVVFSQDPNDQAKYNVADMAFGGAYGGPRDGALNYNATTKTLSIVYVESYYQSKWELVSVTDEVLTLKWTNNFTTRYSEYGTVELRRNDGLTWPEGLTIVNL